MFGQTIIIRFLHLFHFARQGIIVCFDFVFTICLCFFRSLSTLTMRPTLLWTASVAIVFSQLMYWAWTVPVSPINNTTMVSLAAIADNINASALPEDLQPVTLDAVTDDNNNASALPAEPQPVTPPSSVAVVAANSGAADTSLHHEVNHNLAVEQQNHILHAGQQFSLGLTKTLLRPFTTFNNGISAAASALPSIMAAQGAGKSSRDLFDVCFIQLFVFSFGCCDRCPRSIWHDGGQHCSLWCYWYACVHSRVIGGGRHCSSRWFGRNWPANSQLRHSTAFSRPRSGDHEAGGVGGWLEFHLGWCGHWTAQLGRQEPWPRCRTCWTPPDPSWQQCQECWQSSHWLVLWPPTLPRSELHVGQRDGHHANTTGQRHTFDCAHRAGGGARQH